jgi:cell division septal protein FtsQ
VTPVTGKERRRAPARAQALPATRPRARTARWLPSGRSLAVGLALLALAGGAYAIARETSVFAVERIDVQGAPPGLAARIRSALAPVEGTSLVSFGRGAADRRLAGFPEIAKVSYDRDFPHTLRVHVTVEQPVAVLRRGPDAWLVSSTGRVLSLLQPGSYPPLPRIWLAAEMGVAVGGDVETGRAALVATALTRQRLPVRVLAVRDEGAGGIVLQLTGAREVRLGDSSNLAVKLAVAAAILPQAPDAVYVDVSVPTRAVAGYQPTVPYDNAQVSGQG